MTHLGAKLVPVIGFGEERTFTVLTEHENDGKLYKYAFLFLKKAQIFLRKRYGFSFLYFYGKGVFDFLPFPFNIPIVPNQVPLMVVIGEPIPVPQIVDPTKQQIELVKEEFKRQVRTIVSEYGAAYGIKRVNFQ